MAEHTPGPWYVNMGTRIQSPHPERGRGYDNKLGDPIVADARNREDARLIASAPDLLAALELFPSWGGTIKPDEVYDLLTDGRALLAARAAIAKATGKEA